MIYKRIAPEQGLEDLVECYWIIENPDPTPVIQKIIPDGFTEIIFHYGDPYRIKLDEKWKLQKKSLLAGQISKHFSLRNTGISGIFGIKMKPTAMTHLFGLSMDRFTDRVSHLHLATKNILKPFQKKLLSNHDDQKMIEESNNFFTELVTKKKINLTAADEAVNTIFEKNGMLNVSDLCKTTGVGERRLQSLFSKYIGLSPKFYSRLIRFSYIFHLIQENDQSWSSLAYDAAYYDQSHFIRNFKKFTGENPSRYKFDEENMANFFLMKKTHQ